LRRSSEETVRRICGASSRPRTKRSSYRGDENHPVTVVSPLEARRYAEWLALSTGIEGIRLPTEMEFAAAARGPEGRPFPWGPEWNPDLCNGYEDEENGETLPVDAFPLGTSFCGARQLAGNVAEIVESARGGFVARGGSYRHRRNEAPSPACFTDSVRVLSPNERDIDVGFRCAAAATTAPPFPDGLAVSLDETRRGR
jgi:formylglycine-generating enzyme required for sulfatase activity